MPTIKDLSLFQWGRETIHGTAVPATSRIAVEDIEFEETDEVYRPRLAKGLVVENPGNEVVIKRGTSFRVKESPLNFDQLQNFLVASIKGGVVPTGVGPYIWTFDRPLTADPNPDSFTLERRLASFAGNIDHEWTYALFNKLVFKGAEGEACKFEAEGFARRIQSSTLTPAISMPAVEIASPPGTSIFIDSTFAGIGVTQVVGQAVGWEITFETGFKPWFTVDGRSDLDYGVHLVDGKEVKLACKIMLLVDGQFAAEKAAAEAQTLRAVRIQADLAPKQIQFDMLLKHNKGSVFKVGDHEGADLVELDLVSATDGTNLFRVKVTNNTATLS